MAIDQPVIDAAAAVRSNFVVNKGEVSLAVYRKRLAAAPANFLWFREAKIEFYR